MKKPLLTAMLALFVAFFANAFTVVTRTADGQSNKYATEDIANITLSTDGVATITFLDKNVVTIGAADFSCIAFDDVDAPGQDEPEDNPGDEPGDNPGDEPGDNPGDEPGDNPGDEPGDNPGDEPGGDAGIDSAECAEGFTVIGENLQSLDGSAIYVYDLSGKLIAQAQNGVISLSQFNSGVYIIKTTTTTTKIYLQ